MVALRPVSIGLILLLTACTAYVPNQYVMGGSYGSAYGVGFSGVYTAYAPVARIAPPVYVAPRPWGGDGWRPAYRENHEYHERHEYPEHHDGGHHRG